MSRRWITYANKDNFITAQARKFNEIIYGSQSLKAQLGPFSREPNDWDILSPNPRRSAKRLERTLDRESGGDYYFVRPASHKGTFKVEEVGFDNKPKTDDDLPVADYTQTSGRKKGLIKTPLGRVVGVDTTFMAKKKTLNDAKYEYRWEKDLEDVERIRFFKKHILLREDED